MCTPAAVLPPQVTQGPSPGPSLWAESRPQQITAIHSHQGATNHSQPAPRSKVSQEIQPHHHLPHGSVSEALHTPHRPTQTRHPNSQCITDTQRPSRNVCQTHTSHTYLKDTLQTSTKAHASQTYRFQMHTNTPSHAQRPTTPSPETPYTYHTTQFPKRHTLPTCPQ